MFSYYRNLTLVDIKKVNKEMEICKFFEALCY